MDKPIRCECGKVLAVMRNGKIYIKCKGCKRQVELENIEEKPHKITH